MGWISKEINLGLVGENEKVVFQFKYKGNIKDIKDLKPGCGGCTKVIKIEDSGVFTIMFKSGSIPKHLKGQDLPFQKKISVHYTDKNKESDNLYFFGTITED